MKNHIPFLVLLLAVLSLIWLMRPDTDAAAAEPFIDWAEGFSSPKDMLEASQMSVAGTVTEAREIWADSLACRRYTLQVQAVHKGDLPVGSRLDVIIVNNPGGPEMRVDSSYTLCLKPSTRTGCTDAWEILGSVQGLAEYTDTADFAANFAGNFK